MTELRLAEFFAQNLRRSVSWSMFGVAAYLTAASAGCATSAYSVPKTIGNDTTEMDAISIAIDKPAPPIFEAVIPASTPITAEMISKNQLSYADLTLNDVLRDGLHNAPVLRDIGGVILRSPEVVKTGYSTQMQEADPRYGMEAALSAFDAQLATSANLNKNDRIYNNSFFAGGTNAFQQQLNDYQMELSKKTATGSLLAIRGVSNSDWNNAPANTFPSAWNSWLEGEIRQPLLQGGGLEFNRIAGPGATPGVYNGLLIAKANADMNQHDFMIALTDFVSNVENAYWDLYVAYRELDARKKAMEQAQVEWNRAKASSPEDEPLARQQYYQLKAEVDETLSGRILSGTQVRNGATGGTLQAGSGVLTAERRLRLLCGLPASDGRMIRPAEEPAWAPFHFDWECSVREALVQRSEIQKQHIAVKKREMELLAAKNFLNPRLDAVGRYRFRGFGDDFINQSGTQKGPTPSSSLGNFASGDYQEWMMGVELTVPIGYRKAHAAVDYASLAVARERVVLKEQQREIASNLSGAMADTSRAFLSVDNNLNQYLAAKEHFDGLKELITSEKKVSSERVLDAQRRVVNAEVQMFRARAEYAVSLKNFHYEKGSLLTYKDLRLSSSLPMEDDIPVSDEALEIPAPEMPVESDADIPQTDSTQQLTPGIDEADEEFTISTVPETVPELEALPPVE